MLATYIATSGNDECKIQCKIEFQVCECMCACTVYMIFVPCGTYMMSIITYSFSMQYDHTGAWEQIDYALLASELLQW